MVRSFLSYGTKLHSTINNHPKKHGKVITIPVFIEIALVMLLGAVDTVMLSFALDENIRGVILLRRWRSGKWRSKGFVSERK